ncbi:MAG: flavodoxin family protein [Nitrospinae bacterium]|nr:flavodoxin family protein [Nitrospinota bacterium]
MAKIIGFVGSPRKEGNTEKLIKTVLEGAAEKGAETELIYLNDLNIRGCQGCDKCKETKHCATEDDMLPLHQKIIEADGIVVGSPIYAHYVTGQTKTFLDRWYAFQNKDLTSWIPKGKRFIFAISYAEDDKNLYRGVLSSLSEAITPLKPEYSKALILAGTQGKDDAEKNSNVLEKAKGMGQALV